MSRVAQIEIIRRRDMRDAHHDGLHPKQEQAALLFEQSDELLYGGAAGGGKTWWLCREAIYQMERWPRNVGVIFRRQYLSLDETVKPLLNRALLSRTGGPGRARWIAGDRSYLFPNGSRLRLAHLQQPDAWMAYQGMSLGFIGFEEATEFLPRQLDELRARLRSPAPGIKPRMALTTNPGGKAHREIKAQYVRPPAGVHDPDFSEPPAPMVVWRPKPTDGDPEPPTRCYVPATLDDNPTLLANDPRYGARLAQIKDRGRRLAMREGDWDALEEKPGALWSADVIEATRLWDVRAWNLAQVVVAVDPAWSGRGDMCGIVVVGRDGGENDPDGRAHGYVLADYSMLGRSHEWAPVVMRAAKEHGAGTIVGEAARDAHGDDVRIALTAAGWQGRFEPVRAKVGKYLRAEPVSALWLPDGAGRAPRCHFVGGLPDVEAELCDWEVGDASPNRLDALVHGITYVLGLQPADVREQIGPSIPASGIIDAAWG